MFTKEVRESKEYIDLFRQSKNLSPEIQLLLDKECIDGFSPVKLYEPQAVLVNEINSQEVLETISFAGRMAWQKDWNKDPESFVRHILKMNHESVIEHVCFNFALLTDRATSHEIVRHRMSSFTQLSQRYVSYADTEKPVPIVLSTDLDNDAKYLITESAITSVSEYRLGVSFGGVKPEVARQVLPNSVGTIMIYTVNPRSLRNFLSLRMAKGAYSPIRSIANQIYDIMIESGLEVFVEDFKDLRQYDPRNKIEKED